MNITIPPEVVEAGAKAIAVDHGDAEWKWRSYEDAARAAFLAMLEAWPGMWTSYSVGNGSIILPLPQEGRDE